LARSGARRGGEGYGAGCGKMAEGLGRGRDLAQAVHCLRSALKLIQLEVGSRPAMLGSKKQTAELSATSRVPFGASRLWTSFREGMIHWATVYAQTSSIKRSIGAVLGIAVWVYLWLAKPDIGLQPTALKQLAFLSLA